MGIGGGHDTALYVAQKIYPSVFAAIRSIIDQRECTALKSKVENISTNIYLLLYIFIFIVKYL